MTTKFHIGDRLVRKAYKNSKSQVMRDECCVVNIVNDEHPICPQIWYVVVDFRGRTGNGLKEVMEQSYCKVR